MLSDSACVTGGLAVKQHIPSCRNKAIEIVNAEEIFAIFPVKRGAGADSSPSLSEKTTLTVLLQSELGKLNIYN